MSESATEDRRLRSDAERNRERVVAAAVVALHRDGAGVPIATIADDAGVGVGTVYRHFRNREVLVEELTHRSFTLMVGRLQHAQGLGGTAVEAFRDFLLGVIQDRNDMVLRSTGGPAVESERVGAVQAELHRGIRELIARGLADGTIRREIDVADIAWLGATLAQPGREGRAWERICERLLDTYLAGLGAP
ncbi:TetR/AcrR family transcriptional regulator [Luteipulveratus sp. YIM 133132]|uniref:TetR/AcrR family transcriptional regulator n=1 Tax=Luteipulveratus flavus TaxID=3031728 RepID=A0ABT6CDG4_9MICO|nr:MULTISPECIES: TetR/AcrR family transcriptional regulator [unclassified Luteipulveratus]MDE9367760.1 TetR/AcrR family transcriptional regulator [Luteipulveratus sp. YIM 133132]MDF8266064.1 TetR/AcrR family transcriptional regulator [Luteipulveratus sp. YIM 133296]